MNIFLPPGSAREQKLQQSAQYKKVHQAVVTVCFHSTSRASQGLVIDFGNKLVSHLVLSIKTLIQGLKKTF